MKDIARPPKAKGRGVVKKKGFPAPRKWAHNQSEAAQILGVSRMAFGRWQKIAGNPGKRANGRYNIPEWEKWKAENRPLLESKETTEEPVDTFAAERRQISLDTEREKLRGIRLKNAEQEGRVMPTEEVSGLIFTVLAQFDFHLVNAERDIAMKMAEISDEPLPAMKEWVRKRINDFRLDFLKRPMPDEAKKELTRWHALAPEVRDRIVAGELTPAL